MSGVLVLSLSCIVVKVIGLAYKIPMMAYLGAEGMGYFNSAYELFALLCTTVTAGVPTALSVAVSSRLARAEKESAGRLYKLALLILIPLGFLGSLGLFLLARPLSALLGNEGSRLCLMAIAPSFFCVCFSGAVRGFFQGHGKMSPTAVSQALEALGKLLLGVGLAAFAARRGQSASEIAAFAALGLSLGMVISSGYLWVMRRIRGHSCSKIGPLYSMRGEVAELLKIAFPLTVGSAAMGITRLIDTAMILRRLPTIGHTVAEANYIYGSYTTLAVPDFGLIPSLITPIAMALIPQLSAAVEEGSAERQGSLIRRAIRLTVLLAMPSALGIAVYARPILALLFEGQPDAVRVAAPMLSVLGCAVFFSGLVTTLNAILNAYRRTWLPILAMGIGAPVKAIFAYVLLGIPSVGAMGAPISTLLCDLSVTAISLFFLGGLRPGFRSVCSLRLFVKPAFASFLAVLGSLCIYTPLRQYGALALMAAILGAIVLYGGFVILLRIVTEEDLEGIPLLEKASRLYRRRKAKTL